MRILAQIRGGLRKIAGYELTTHAANASFFLLLSCFPAMMLLLALIQLTPIPADDLTRLLTKALPSALRPLVDYMGNELFAGNSAGLISVSTPAALWIASKGTFHLVRGLNRVYGVPRVRGYLLQRVRCVLFTLLLLVALVAAVGLYLLGRQLLAQVGLAACLLRLKSPLLALFLTLLFAWIYCVFPDRRRRFLPSLPGAACAACVWVLFSAMFSYYVNQFGHYSFYYGSLSIMAIAMLWLYSCMLILLGGALLNVLLAQDDAPSAHASRRA